MVPRVSAEGYRAAREAAALLDRSDRGRIVVSGADRATYLNGLLTNDIAALAPGTGCYAAYLTPQGRMIADLFVYNVGDVLLLSMDGSVTATVLGKLDQFIFSEDVQLGDVSIAFAQTAVVGPDAPRVVAQVVSASSEVLAAMPLHACVRLPFHGESVVIARTADLGEPGFDLYVPGEQAGQVDAGLRRAGAVAIDRDTAEALRIEAGVPTFRADMDEETIPLEAGIESRAISFSKGCYVGQEVIIRVLHRGHGRVARKLAGLVMAGGDPPPAGSVVVSTDDSAKDVGAVTSSTNSPVLGHAIALAYLHRDYLPPGTVLKIAGIDAVVTALPFVERQALKPA